MAYGGFMEDIELGSHLSIKAKYFWTEGVRFRQTLGYILESAKMTTFGYQQLTFKMFSKATKSTNKCTPSFIKNNELTDYGI